MDKTAQRLVVAARWINRMVLIAFIAALIVVGLYIGVFFVAIPLNQGAQQDADAAPMKALIHHELPFGSTLAQTRAFLRAPALLAFPHRYGWTALYVDDVGASYVEHVPQPDDTPMAPQIYPQGETLLVELDRDDRTMYVALFFNKAGHFIRFNVFDGFRGPF